MAYVPYADAAFYEDVFEGSVLSETDLEKRLKKASRHIDVLTFNRIVAIGFDNLTEFQKEIIQETVCELAEFEYENEDLINSVLQSYSLNGVSFSLGNSQNVKIQDGVVILNEQYGILQQTGLCCRVI